MPQRLWKRRALLTARPVSLSIHVSSPMRGRPIFRRHSVAPLLGSRFLPTSGMLLGLACTVRSVVVCAPYGHLDSGTYCEEHCDAQVLKAGFKPMFTDTWPSCYYAADLKLYIV